MVKSRLHIKSLFLCLLVTVILYVSGCGEKANPLPSPVQTAVGNLNESVTKTSLMDSVGLQNLSESVWKDVPVLTLDSSQKLPITISDDGDLLWIEWTKEDEEKGTPNDTLVLYNIKTGSQVAIASIKYPAQIVKALINEDWIVWMQYLYGDGYGDGSYAIYSYNRKTNDTKLCFKADSQSKDSASLSFKAPTPSLKGNKLLLDILSSVSGKGEISTVCYEYDLVSGRKREIAKQIICPEFEDDYIIGIAQDEDNIEKGYSIICKIDNSVITPLMEKGIYIYEYSTDGHGSALYTAQTIGNLGIAKEKQIRDLYLLENGKSILLKAQNPDDVNSGCSWPSISTRVAMWRNDNCPYAYDRLLQKAIKLSDDKQRTSNFFTTDSYIVWTYRSEQNIEADINNADLINVISTKDLPLR